MGTIVKYNLPCTAQNKPPCGSSNAMCEYDDGGKVCHRCQGWDNRGKTGKTGYTGKQPTQERKVTDSAPVGTPVDLSFYYQGKYKDIPERRIAEATCKKYGVRTDDSGAHMFPGYSAEGELIAVKTCIPAQGDSPKRHIIKGPWTSCVLFGANSFPKTGRILTVTEGEYDALAAFQMTGSKYPNVSILTGCASAKKDFTSNFDAMGEFDSIVINFDSDAPGKAAAQDVGPMFPGKTKVMALVEAKDACDYLKSNKIKKYIAEFWAAKTFTIGGTINGRDTWDAYKEQKNVKSLPFPPDWSILNQKSYGVRKGEIILVTAGTGAGKSQWLRELKYFWLTKTKERIFDIALEEQYTDSVGGLMALEANKRISLPDVHIEEAEEKRIHTKLFDSGRILFHDHEGSYDDSGLIDQITNAVVVEKCGIIFLDHITIAVSDAAAGEENMSMDRFMGNLLRIVKKYKVTIVVVSHLRKTGGGGKSFEEGRVPCEDDLKGSGSLKQVSMTTIALARDKYDPDEKIRNTTSFHLLKCRFSGRSGPCDHAYFDDTTGRMVAVDPAVFFDEGTYDGGAVGSPGGFKSEF